MKNESHGMIKTWMTKLVRSRKSEAMSQSKLLSFPPPTPHTRRSFEDSTPSTDDSTSSKPNSTETAVEPSDAPIAIESPRAVQSKINGTNNIINNGMVGPWLIILTAIACVSITMVVMDRADREEDIESKIQSAVAQAELRIRADVAADTAQAKAVAHTAETHARVALDKVETAEVELGKKGINIRADGH